MDEDAKDQAMKRSIKRNQSRYQNSRIFENLN
jgi:hypothetical protein